tara:strand:+ start:435 stop:923 length:489 start_codon:yes stop_codon:yes gene_type:complete
VKLIYENWRGFLSGKDWEAEAENIDSKPQQLNTVGDLRAVLAKAITSKKTSGGLAALKKVGISAVLDLAGISTAKTLYDVFQAMYNLPDDKKTNTALDKLNVDDQVSKVVDDTVENSFLKGLQDKFEGIPDDTPLKDLDMTKLLSQFISDEFEKTNVSGAPG